MSYIGKEPEFTQYPSKFFNGDGTAMTVSLDYATPNDAALLVFIDGVRQDTSAYNCVGTSLTFTGSVPSGTNNVQVVHMGLLVDVGVPADDTISTAKIQDDAVTADKLANSINTEIAANTAKVTNATHTGDVTGATALTIAADAVDIAMLSATGTASSSTFLRGDNSWQTAGVSTLAALTDATVSAADPAADSDPSAVGHLWLNSSSGESYVCIDATAGANAWQNIGDGTGSIGLVTATGGTTSTYSSGGVNYKAHTFTSSGNFVVSTGGQCDIMIVGAGGGGGGGNCGSSCGSIAAGGGGGSVLYKTGHAVTAQTYALVIGAGGAGGVYPNSTATQGASSTGFGETATGGGGGSNDGATGGNGANGGGGARNNSGGTGTAPTASGWTVYGGNDGGDGQNADNYPAGGGGGANAVGTTPSSTTAAGGDGGVGIQLNLDNNNYYWAGGGGGSSYTGSNGGGNGGLGGGGGGAAETGTDGSGGGSAINSGGAASGSTGGAGGANSGGGGGGNSYFAYTNGLAGGSGCVIIRYKV